MNREIKFRAWDDSSKDNSSKNLCEWKLCENHNVKNDIGFHFINGYGFTYPWEHPDLIKMQFIGLTDKNGKDIYEGDVLKHDRDKAGTVKWMSSEYDIGWVCRFPLKHGSGWTPNLFREQKHIEVIGNIHENPELLKK